MTKVVGSSPATPATFFLFYEKILYIYECNN